MNTPPGTISFRLFGIPVYISPYSWLFLALLGGGWDLRDGADLPGILIFVVVGMITLLCHELGHALVGRWLGGEPHAIVVEGLGAVTHSNPPRGRWRYFLMVLAGPLATLLPAVVALSALVVWAYAMPAADGLDVPPLVAHLCFMGIYIPVGWCLFNLLPILPLDGGHLLATLLPLRRLVCVVGMLASITIAVLSLPFGAVFMVILFGYFAYINIRLLCARD